MISKRKILANAMSLSGMNRMLTMVQGWSGLLVLNYHRIGDFSKSLFDQQLYSATSEVFEKQVQYLVDNFDLIGTNDLSDVLEKKTGQHVMLTFDDGYRDNYELAFPILKKYHAPATFFITTGYLDKKQVPWWDDVAWMIRSAKVCQISASQWQKETLQWNVETPDNAIYKILKCYKQLPPEKTEPFLNFIATETASGRCPQEEGDSMWMTWDMVREMSSAGMSFGGHTVNHPVLSRLSKGDQLHEIAECKKRLEEELSQQIDTFSYPVGGLSAFNETTIQCLIESGYHWAFSYYGGYCSFKNIQPFDLPRFPIEPEICFPQLRSTLAMPQIFA